MNTVHIDVSPLQDSELTELKETIEILRAKNTEAQEIIQGALSNPDITPKGTKSMIRTVIFLSWEFSS